MKRLSLLLVALAFAMFSCKPEIEKPTVVTKSVGEVTETTAKVVGQVAADGGAEVTERGVCWSADGTPTILDYRVKDAEGGLGTYMSSLSDLESNTTYYVRAYATNEAGTSYGEEKSFTTEKVGTPEEPEDPNDPNEPETPEMPDYNGHEYVDLGLPSGLKWATCNVGATSPEDYGDYFAWGETETKEDYSSSTSLTYGFSISELKSQGYIDENGNLTASHDAATANWGGAWRMPTKAEFEELKNNCSWKWTTQNGVNGYKVTGTNGNSIFLPAAGCRSGSSLYDAGSDGYYWSSTPNESRSDSAWSLYFNSSEFDMNSIYRGNGRSVRPVIE